LKLNVADGALAKAEETQHCNNHDHKTNDIDNVIHPTLSLLWRYAKHTGRKPLSPTPVASTTGVIDPVW
jgi:hypothetical protein